MKFQFEVEVPEEAIALAFEEILKAKITPLGGTVSAVKINPVDNMTLRELLNGDLGADLPTRMHGGLRSLVHSGSITLETTLADLAKVSMETLREIPNVSPQTVRRFKSFMEQHGAPVHPTW